MSLKVGDTIYQFREGRGESHKNNWKPAVITGETTRSWIIGGEHKWMQEKVAKKDLEAGSLNHFKKTMQEVEEESFVADHGYFITQCASGNRNYATLKAIADLIGYNPATKSCRR
jgi:hypothetical protein